MIEGLKATGIVRKIDDLGRLVIPKELVKSIGYETKQNVDIHLVDNEYIVVEMAEGTGIIRKLDELNRLVIPKEIRKMLGLDVQTPIEIFVANDNVVVLRRYSETCAICGRSSDLYFVKRKKVCEECLKFIKENF